MPIDTLLETLITELDDDNTIAFGLTGSYARGDATPHSDVDLWQFVKTMPDDPYAKYTLRQVQDHLVSLSIRTLAHEADKLKQPDSALAAVPGLRQMRVLRDKTGELGALLQAAHDFKWDTLQSAANDYASHELAGQAEEAHKIMTGLQQAEDTLMLYWLMGLLFGLTHAVAVHKGLIIDSENHYFRNVQLAVGDQSAWTHHHRAALGLLMASPSMRAHAGLRLYRDTVALLEPVILPGHVPVIQATLQRMVHFVG